MGIPKFNFIPEGQLNGKSQSEYTVSIFKNGVLSFRADDVNIYELDGKYIQIYADQEKKTIGWSIIEGKTNLPEINSSRQLKKNVHGSCMLGITKILNVLGIKKGTAFLDLRVKKYMSALHSHDVYYVELKTNEKTE